MKSVGENFPKVAGKTAHHARKTSSNFFVINKPHLKNRARMRGLDERSLAEPPVFYSRL
jgi:hypothetical protein